MPEFSFLQSLNKMIYKLCSYFDCSCKRVSILNKTQEEFLTEDLRQNQNILKLIRPFDVRWLSYSPAIERIIELYPSIISALQDIYTESKDDEANELFNRLIKFDQIALYHSRYIESNL